MISGYAYRVYKELAAESLALKATGECPRCKTGEWQRAFEDAEVQAILGDAVLHCVVCGQVEK